VNFGPLTGGTNYALAQTAGAEQVTLTSATVPAHNHTISVTKADATAMIPAASNAPANVGTNLYYCNESQAGTVFQTAPQTVASAGGGNQPHTNIQPSLVLSYAIAVNGLFPELTN
jgi:microcystin-dependent protein